MLVLFKCKHCDTTFPVRLEAFSVDIIKCPKCSFPLEERIKNRLYELTSIINSLNNTMNDFTILELTESSEQKYILEDFSHLDELYIKADKNSRALFAQILDNLYLITRSSLERGDLKELASTYEYIHKYFLEKCHFKEQIIKDLLLNSPTDDSTNV